MATGAGGSHWEAISEPFSILVDASRAGGLPPGWRCGNVGPGENGAGFCEYEVDDELSPNIVVRGAGADIWGSADAFHYAYKALNGDGEIVARVVSVTNVDVWTKVGVMIRDGLTAGAAHACCCSSAL